MAIVISKKLLEIYPNEKEGILDKKFASLVNKKTCLEIAKTIGLQKYILTFDTKKKINKIKNKEEHSVVYPFEVRPPQGAMSVRRTAAMPRTAAAAASQGGKSSRFPLGSRLP